MEEKTIEQLAATAERLANAAEALDRVLERLDAQQESLNAKVDRIVAAVEDDQSEAPVEITANRELQEKITTLEKANHDLRAQAARMTRKTLSPENAALALLDDGPNDGWTGEYTAWSDFLPGGADDIFPGDALQIKASSRQASFLAVITEVDVVVKDLVGEHSQYTMKFVDAADRSLAFQFEKKTNLPPADLIALTTESVSSPFLPSLTSAAITKVTSTTVTIDVGVDQPIAGGIEVRWSDFGWGQANDRNLAGRFATRSFTLPRLSRSEDYYLRQYDSSAPPKYSRYTMALHVDYPF